ncbi:MAG: hypothetical protein HY047_13910 [Acidobacteria bacterium]|nr:hypothetical protein [Acidobacteriota bacterium]
MSSPRQPYVWLIIVATLVIGSCWGTVIPPFESADESAFYNAIVRYTHGEKPGGWLLYAAAVKPAMKLAGGPDRLLQARYNPSFRFVSNLRGRVNMYVHGRAGGMPRGDVNRMYLLRLCTLLIWTVSLLLIFETARLFAGRSDLALLTAGACLFLPEASFFASKIHPEATTVLLASAAYCAFTARVCGRLGRLATWIIGLAVLMAAPFSDRQAYFLVMFVPFGLVLTEPTRRGALLSASALIAATVAAFLIVPRPVEMQRDLTMWLAPMLTFFKLTWWNPYLWLHLKYEFIPKMFLGFWGWLGQPSILLPAPVYAAFAVTSSVALVGLAIPSWPGEPERRDDIAGPTAERRRLGWLYAGGVFLTFAPILYTNAMIDRIVVGRWMLPSLAPIMIALVFGGDAVVGAARRRPHRVAAILAAIGAALALLWVSPAGAAIRDGIRHYHYGDQEHLIRIVTDSIVGMFIAAACVEGAARVRWGVAAVGRDFQPRRSDSEAVAQGFQPSVMIFAGAWALNLTLLFTFVAPLYRPFDDAEYADAVRAEAAAGEFDRAAALLRLAQRAYPQSAPLNRVLTEMPLISLRGDSDQLLADVEARIGRGQALTNRDELMALARAVPRAGWFEPDALRELLARAKDAPELREPLALIRAELDGRQRDGSAAADIIRAAGGTVKRVEIPGVAMVEGLTTYRRPEGGLEVRIYFRPLREWSRLKLLLYVAPAESGGPSAVDPSVPLFNGWRTGELAWEVFTLPDTTAWRVWAAAEVEQHPPVDGFDLGVIGR